MREYIHPPEPKGLNLYDVLVKFYLKKSFAPEFLLATSELFKELASVGTSILYYYFIKEYFVRIEIFSFGTMQMADY